MVERRNKKISVEQPAEPKKLKCVVVGEKGCGKSSFVRRFCGIKNASQLPTVGSDFYSRTLKVAGGSLL